mgnify:FL=1
MTMTMTMNMVMTVNITVTMTYLTGVDLTGNVVQVDGDGAANVEVDPLDADDGAAGAGPELGRHPRHRDVAVSGYIKFL